MKKVYFLYETTAGPYGGINSFNRALLKTMQDNPHPEFMPTPHPEDADLLFLSAASRGPTRSGRDRKILPWQLKNLQSGRMLYDPRGFFGSHTPRPVVHRLDGLTSRYGRKNGQLYDTLQKQLNQLATKTIFQSQFCMDSFRSASGPLPGDCVIPNGVDGQTFLFQRRSPPGTLIRFVASSWSSNPNKGHAACALLSTLPGVHVLFFGHWPQAVDRQCVEVREPLPHSEMARAYHSADAFVHMALFDPAPNVVTEALATGLPILYLKSGGTGEIVKNDRYGVPVSAADKVSLQAGLDQFRSRWLSCYQALEADRQDFLIDTTYRHYAEVFRESVILDA